MEQRKPKLIPCLPLYCSCVQELCVDHHQPGTAAHTSPSQDLHVLDELLNIASSERQAPVITDKVAPWQQLEVTKDVINPMEITTAGFFFPPEPFSALEGQKLPSVSTSWCWLSHSHRAAMK